MAAGSSDRRAIITEALRKIDELSARLAVAEQGDTEPIAVVGMGCRLPGGVSDPDGYWQLLQDGRSGIVRVPSERWDADELYSADSAVPGTICTREGGFLTSWQPDEFDAEFFGISPREAAAMDPQQRLLMEVSWEALEHAGIPAQNLRGTQTAVFVGLTTNDYSLLFAGKLRREDIDPYVPFGNAANFAAGRLSYFLGVRGPAVVVDTACSSSLVSVHLACQSLRRRESDTALAAGVNLMLSPENSIACSRWGMLAPDGQCKTFDAGADGYVRSEGCGVVVLKRLGDAQADGDRILAVVRGSAVNQDGASSGQTVPNGPAQQALLRQALASSRLTAADIDYIEAHGTGTALGDPIELDALSAVFGERGNAAPLVLGSVKTNLGHLESGAGIAGFIKTVLSVRYGYIPKHLNFECLTPHAGPSAAQFTIAADGMEWPAVARARRAGVSSFGVSGTNAHIIIEQAPAPEPARWEPDPAVCTLVVSGKSEERIAATAGALAEWMTGAGAGVALADVAHTLNHHRARHAKFATVCARDRAQAVTALRALSVGHNASGLVRPHEGPCGSGTVFVFSGQGSQWAGMGRRLLADEPAFAAAVAELEPVFVEQVGFSLQQVLADGEAVAGDARVQPVIMGLQLALSELWRSYGVTPDAVIGHSMGEVTAAVVAGALSPAEGLRVIAVRSRLMSRLAGQGAVALLTLDAEAAEALIADFDDVSIAGHLAPEQTVIAGPPAQVDAIIEAATAAGAIARRVNMEVASHTALMDPILGELRDTLADLAPQTPVTPFFSTVDATTAPLLNADYWVANVRRPVRLHQAVSAAGAHGHTTFVEISPHPVLTRAICDSLAEGHHHVVGTLARDTDDTHTFHTNLNTTHAARPPVTPHPPEPHPLLPPTPWHHTHHWIRVKAAGPWTTHESVTIDTSAPWLLVADTRHGSSITETIAGDVTVVPPQALADEGSSALAQARNVLWMPDLSANGFDTECGYRLIDEFRLLTAALVAAAGSPLLFLSVPDREELAPARAILWGLAHSFADEHPGMWGGFVALDVADNASDDRGDGESVPSGDIKDVWRTLPTDGRRAMLRRHVSVLIAAVMGLPSPEVLDPEADFFDLGMDSMMSVVLQRALLATLGEEIPSPVLFDNPTVATLADHLVVLAETDVDSLRDLAEVPLPEKVS
ncbi:polyketide synthase [Mycobacterium sp. IS-1496]|uniref:type I polyketide synthase n=1 Tax=Mycobacterium sp. IS-1496 TaxID=1772284 RepID=UPI0007417AF3|nr:type I polyketide synthase [Mycobacterium sp. IS-1496]KUI38199.1 polyketide synthase [Mycobacterium sp. IS-1496]